VRGWATGKAFSHQSADTWRGGVALVWSSGLQRIRAWERRRWCRPIFLTPFPSQEVYQGWIACIDEFSGKEAPAGGGGPTQHGVLSLLHFVHIAGEARAWATHPHPPPLCGPRAHTSVYARGGGVMRAAAMAIGLRLGARVVGACWVRVCYGDVRLDRACSQAAPHRQLRWLWPPCPGVCPPPQATTPGWAGW
jgi:hypothetical protein